MIGVTSILKGMTYWFILSFFVLLVCFFSFTYIPIGSNFALAVQSISTFLGALAGAGIAGYLTLKVSEKNWEREQQTMSEKQETLTIKNLKLFTSSIAFMSKQKDFKDQAFYNFDAIIRRYEQHRDTIINHQEQLLSIYYDSDSYYLSNFLEEKLLSLNAIINSRKSSINFLIESLKQENVDFQNTNDFMVNNINNEIEEAKKILKEVQEYANNNFEN